MRNWVCFLMVNISFLCADQYYSQFGQDKFVYEHFFLEKTEGIFIDIGAHDGISFSNTKFFEELGWTGICVEPIPEVFNQLKSNRLCACIQACVGSKRGKGIFLRCRGYTEMLSGLFNEYDPRHLERIKQEQRIYNGSLEKIEVDIYTLNDLLEQNGISYVDYLSVDTEGNELSILQSIDFSRFKIKVIDVENNYKDNGNELFNFLFSKNYKHFATIGCDEIFELSE